MDIIPYINIFQLCLVEIIENIVLPGNMYHYSDLRVEFPVIRSFHVYWDTSRHTLGSTKWFHMFCDDKVAISITPNGYRYNATKPQLKNHFAPCEGTFYITPFNDCQKWSIDPKYMPHKATTSDGSRKLPGFHYKDEDPSAIYRSNKYYIVVGNTVTMTQAMKGHIFYEIDVPRMAPTAPRSFSFHTKFYLELKRSDVSFYFAEIENVDNIIERLTKQCSGYDKSNGILRYLSILCVYNNYIESKYTLIKLDFNKLKSEKTQNTLVKIVSLIKPKFEQLYWVLQCPICNTNFTGATNLQTNYQLRKWKGYPSLELIAVHIMFKNSTILSDIRYSHKQLPLPQLYIEQSINRMQFVRIENKGFHFVTCANILKGSGLNFIVLLSSFDLFTWLSLVVVSILSTLVLICLLKYSNIKYDIYDVYSLSTKILLEQNVPKFSGNTCYVIGSWFLVGVIISQCCKGDNITQLIAPFKKPKLEHFSQLLEGIFSFFSRISYQHIWKQEEDALKLLEGFAPFLNVFIPGKFEKEFTEAFLSEFEVTYVNSVTSENLSIVGKINESLSRSNRIENFSQIITGSNHYVDKLELCGRQAYIGNYENAYYIYNQLIDKLENGDSDLMDSLSLSKETLAPTVTTWRFEKVPIDSDQFITRVHSFLQSGILDVWNKWNLRIQTYNGTILGARRSKHPVKSLSMHDNVLVIFYLWMSLLGIDCVVFGKEILVWFLMKVWLNRNVNKVSNEI